MPDLPDWMLVHTVSVESQTGEGAYGDTYGSAVDVAGFLDQEIQIVRNTDGAEVTSSGRFFTTLDKEDLFPPDSRVTLPDGTKTYVIKTARRDGGNLPVPEHLEVVLA